MKINQKINQKKLNKKLIIEKEHNLNDKMNTLDYSNISYQLTKEIDKNEKKNNGIFFTHPKTIYKNFERLEPFMKNIQY